MLSRSLLIAAVVLTASPASAQSWIERAARGAAENAARGAVTSLLEARPERTPQPDREEAAAEAEAEAETVEAPRRPAVRGPALTFAEPSPVNYSSDLRGPYQLEFSPEQEAAEARFDAFNVVPCHDCEGGRAYDSWIKHHVSSVSGLGALERRIGEMAVGEAIRWDGSSGARLALTVIGDSPVGDWPCKQVRWSSERGQESAERLGLFCFGKRGDYLGDGWVEVL